MTEDRAFRQWQQIIGGCCIKDTHCIKYATREPSPTKVEPGSLDQITMTGQGVSKPLSRASPSSLSCPAWTSSALFSSAFRAFW